MEQTAREAPAQRRAAGGKVGRFFRQHGWSYVFVLHSMFMFVVFVVIPMLLSF